MVGASACAPTPIGAASGYLIDHPSGTLLLDCGPGVVARLAEIGALDRLTGVVISHRHADHSADLIALAFRRAWPVTRETLPLWAPSGFASVLAGLDVVYGIPTITELAAPASAAFELTEIEPGSAAQLGDLRMLTRRAIHPVPTLSMRFPSLDFVYTADTGPSAELVQLCLGVGVLLAEATYIHADGVDIKAHGHLTARTAGELAACAGVGELVLTHLADPDRADQALAEAASVFDGPISVAVPGMELSLADSS